MHINRPKQILIAAILFFSAVSLFELQAVFRPSLTFSLHGASMNPPDQTPIDSGIPPPAGAPSSAPSVPSSAADVSSAPPAISSVPPAASSPPTGVSSAPISSTAASFSDQTVPPSSASSIGISSQPTSSSISVAASSAISSAGSAPISSASSSSAFSSAGSAASQNSSQTFGSSSMQTFPSSQPLFGTSSSSSSDAPLFGSSSSIVIIVFSSDSSQSNIGGSSSAASFAGQASSGFGSASSSQSSNSSSIPAQGGGGGSYTTPPNSGGHSASSFSSKAPFCGDGFIDPGEECDGGFLNNNAGTCGTDCKLNFCGNGEINAALGEECDGEVTTTTDADGSQRTQISFPVYACGNSYCAPPKSDGSGGCHVVTPPQCTGSVSSASSSHSQVVMPIVVTTHIKTPILGVSRISSAPILGISHAASSTSEMFLVTQYTCGNGALDPGEQCDAGDHNSDTEPHACRLNCRAPHCGDGTIDPYFGEVCDDGSRNSDVLPDHCRASCALPKCGDNVVDSGEECDGGANCDQNCRLLPTAIAGAATCGDGIVETGEECDDGGANGNGSCSIRCQSIPAGCGDGIVNGNEQCDQGIHNSDQTPNACRSNCRLSFCGDGIVDLGEACDDGNTDDTDRCSNSCQKRVILSLICPLGWTLNQGTCEQESAVLSQMGSSEESVRSEIFSSQTGFNSATLSNSSEDKYSPSSSLAEHGAPDTTGNAIPIETAPHEASLLLILLIVGTTCGALAMYGARNAL